MRVLAWTDRARLRASVWLGVAVEVERGSDAASGFALVRDAGAAGRDIRRPLQGISAKGDVPGSSRDALQYRVRSRAHGRLRIGREGRRPCRNSPPQGGGLVWLR